MKQYEVTFIVDPVLSGDEIKATAKTYTDMLSDNGTIVHNDEMGLRELAYPINRRTSGIYYSVEFQVEKGNVVDQLELALRRDERVIRFLTVKLDKYGIKYNDDKRNGLIAKAKRPERKEDKNDRGGRNNRNKGNNRNKKSTPPAKKAAPAPEKKEAPAPVAKKEEE